jgi:hypothetical protein
MPRAENRERGDLETRWQPHTVYHAVPTSEHALSRKSQLALAIAQGAAVSTWARTNGVSRRTAYRWAAEPKVKAAVRSCRRRALDRAIGRMTMRATWSTDQIVKLAGEAKSESVKLSALRAILSDMMAASEFAGLEERLTEIEEQLHERVEGTTGPG